MHPTIGKFVELIKPRIVVFQLVTFAFGYWISTIFWGNNSLTIYWGLLGTFLVSAGSCVANNIIERELDSQMDRTKSRVLPQKGVKVNHALLFCILLTLSGLIVLFSYTNSLTALMAGITAIMYIFVYTPLKTLTWTNTYIGAIPGALVPLGGWTANSPTLNFIALILFILLFVWQLPHFFAIAWMYKEDYKKAGFKMLPNIDPQGLRTARQIVYNSMLLIIVAAFPFIFSISSILYLVLSIAIGLYLFQSALTFSKNKTKQNARSVMKRSILYLPVLLLALILDFYLPKLLNALILSL